MQLQAVTFLVDDYDYAIDFFTRCLGFALIEDTSLSDSKRWVRVGHPGGNTCLLLAKAEGDEQRAAIGKAAGGRVAYFLHTKDFASDFARMVSRRKIPRRTAIRGLWDSCGV
jgi:catechol 2,3-dioxygenase-like lactoylglutathione lyase family enzyme